MSSLTLSQAIEQGYTHYTLYGSGECAQLSDLNESDLANNKYYLLEKDGIPFNISADTIQEVLNEHIDNQEEFYCEDDTLYDELAKADFEKISELVNVGFKTRFRFPTGIRLIPLTQ